MKNKELKLEKDYSQNINEIVPVGMFVTDKNYVITTWNTQAESITGYTKDKILGKNYMSLAKQVFGNQCNLPSDAVYEGRDLVCREYLINTNNKSIFIKKDTKLIRDENGNIEGLIGSFFDLTQQKQLEAELLELQDKLGFYLDTAKLIFVIINTEGKVVMINEKGAEIMGYSKQEIIGHEWFNFLPEKIRPRVQDVYDDILSGDFDDSEYYENEVMKKDGSEITVGWNNSIIKDEKGSVEGVLSAGIDLTDQKQFEELLRYQATIDDMTKMYNRRTGLEMLKKQHSLSRRYHRMFAICFIDLNGLKHINDTNGHDAGDDYLIKIAKLIIDFTRDADIACRLGGDEYLIIFPESNIDAAELVVNRVLFGIEELNKVNKDVNYSISYGFSTFDGKSAEDMVNKSIDKMVGEADKNMYIMKKENRKTR